MDELERSLSTSSKALPGKSVPTTLTSRLRSRPLIPNEEYEVHLEQAVHALQNDFVSGARQMADTSLSHLATLVDLAAVTARNRDELGRMAIRAAKKMSFARPAMSAAITSCLLRALDEMEQVWDRETEKETAVKSPAQLSRIAGYTIGKILEKRREGVALLGKTFTFWLKNYMSENLPPSSQSRTNILTLSNSSTIRTALLTYIAYAPSTTLHLTILESRPRFEGADMAAQLHASCRASHLPRLKILIAPDCALASVAKNTTIVLLGADRISASGDVSNKSGSLAAAICAKHANPHVRVVVVSEGDKIAAPAAREQHAPVERHDAREVTAAWSKETRDKLRGVEKGVEVFGEWFEWVPAGLIDGYVTEAGVLDKGEVERVGREVGGLEARFFVT